MLSTREEVLDFLREFEECSQEYLAAHGISEHEIANAQLELQWKFLHVILHQHENKPYYTVTNPKNIKKPKIVNNNSINRSPRTTIA